MFKPMLAFSKLPNFSLMKFPVLVSPKLDGIRASMQEGHLVSRSLKPIPNENVQKMFEKLPDGSDGELIQGNPTDEPFRRTTSIVMSSDKPADGIKLYVFDRFAPSAIGFETRYVNITQNSTYFTPNVVIVPHIPVANLEELELAEKEFLERGYEGLMIRSLTGPYKQGRSTEAEGYLMKVKRFEDAEARIDSYYEEQANENTAFTNELGRTARSTHKAGMVAKNRLGGFHVTGVGGRYDGVQFDVASGAMTHSMRKLLWEDRRKVGSLITFKFFPSGGDTKPRHPIFKGFRDERDLSQA
jgi:DNA ligase-1